MRFDKREKNSIFASIVYGGLFVTDEFMREMEYGMKGIWQMR